MVLLSAWDSAQKQYSACGVRSADKNTTSFFPQGSSLKIAHRRLLGTQDAEDKQDFKKVEEELIKVLYIFCVPFATHFSITFSPNYILKKGYKTLLFLTLAKKFELECFPNGILIYFLITCKHPALGDTQA